MGCRLRQVQVSLQGNSRDKCTAVPRSPCCRAIHPLKGAAFLVTVTGNGDCYARLQIKAKSLPLSRSSRKANLTAVFLHPVSLSLWLVQFSCRLSSDISHRSRVQHRGPLALMGQVPDPASVIPTQAAPLPASLLTMRHQREGGGRAGPSGQPGGAVGREVGSGLLFPPRASRPGDSGQLTAQPALMGPVRSALLPCLPPCAAIVQVTVAVIVEPRWTASCPFSPRSSPAFEVETTLASILHMGKRRHRDRTASQPEAGPAFSPPWRLRLLPPLSLSHGFMETVHSVIWEKARQLSYFKAKYQNFTD